MLSVKFVYIIKGVAMSVLLVCSMACGTPAGKEKTADPDSVAAVTKGNAVLVKDSAVTAPAGNALADSALELAQFNIFFEKFKKAAAHNDEKALADLLYFPFQTIDWTNDELADGSVDKAGGHITKEEFHKYYPGLFYEEVRTYLSHAELDNLTVYTDMGGQDYYLTLQRLVDKGAPLFEMYVQRDPEVRRDKTIPGNYFAFVFGKVNGAYKAIGYFGKWPVKE